MKKQKETRCPRSKLLLGWKYMEIRGGAGKIAAAALEAHINPKPKLEP